jgi:signal transduction histidine kinase/DNA-binding response OmpR family regulator
MIRVLLVEDNHADARLLEEHLRDVRDAISITRVETLQAGIAAAAEHDVVLLDLSLPDALGLETLTRMLATVRAVPIIVLTGNQDDRVATEAVAAGAQDYLLKGELTTQLVVKTIRYAIARKKMQGMEVERLKTTEALARARFVADVMAASSSSHDLVESMRAVARVLLPALGDFCVIDLPRARGELHRVTIQAADPALHDAFNEIATAHLPGPRHAQSPVQRALEERKTVVLPTLDIADFHPDARLRELVEQLKLRSSLVTPLIARDRVVAVISLVFGPSGRTYANEEKLLAEEIAGRLALAIDNARLLADAQRALKGRDELLAIVSHDLRNPLGVIDLALGLMARDTSHLATALPRAQRAADRMTTLIEDLLEVSRIDAGTLKVEPAPADLFLLLTDVLEQHRVLCTGKSIKLVGELAPDLGMVDVDNARLVQALGNLLGNAIKFTPKDGSIFLDAQRADGAVSIRVRDTGPGMPPEHLAHIFERFWQAPARRADGVGLGLAIVKGIVDAHNGQIRVESDVGRGTTFSIELPVRHSDG